jgi:putative YjhG/YagF family dehydratase
VAEKPASTFFDASPPSVFDLRTSGDGPRGALPITEETLLHDPSGDLFGWTQNAGMGWDPHDLGKKEYLILSTLGGVRGRDGSPIALGYHTGHWEVGLQMEAAAREIKRLDGVPFAGFCTDPCDGRTQGTVGMFDSLPYRNDAAVVLRRLIRSLPRRRGVIGVASCDKGHPAMMMALAGCADLPGVIVPGGVTLPARGAEDLASVQTLGARYAHHLIPLEKAAELSCRACGSAGGGCQFLGTAATSQVVGEALGLSVPHSALAPSGFEVWLETARQSARAVVALEAAGVTMRDVLTERALHNAMVVHAAFGGSMNLLLHVPAVAHAACLKRPTVEDWARVNRRVPRLVSVIPNGPVQHPTVRVFLAGGVPEVMLHLRHLGLLNLDCLTCLGRPLGDVLDEWEQCGRRKRMKQILREQDNVDPDAVILDPDSARKAGLTSTVVFPVGNIAPEGAVVKSTAIDPSVVGADGVYRKRGPARVFGSEERAIEAIKSHGPDAVRSGDVMIVAGCGPMGTGMEETYQVTAALKHLPWGKEVALITDARFSGLSTGACIGHVAPEALAGGPLGRLRDGDIIEIVIDRRTLEAKIDLVGAAGEAYDAAWGTEELKKRPRNPQVASHPRLPDDTRLWAALQDVSGGTWGGCVYDVDAILEALAAGGKVKGG